MIADIAAQINNCIVDAYASQSLPQRFQLPSITMGGDEVDSGTDCCGGELFVKFSDISKSSKTLINNDGRDCYNVWDVKITILLNNCIEEFSVSNGWANGSGVPLNERQLASMEILEEGFFIMNALECCARTHDDWFGVKISSQSQRVIGDCVSQVIKMNWELALCCN